MTEPPTALSGSCAFRLMPGDDLADAPSSARLTRVGGGLTLHYDWTHPTEGPQHGVLLIGGAAEDGTVEVGLFDTFHQQPGLMTLTGTRDGDRVDVHATYLETWGWEISLVLALEAVTMVMRNVIPAEALTMLPPDAPPVAAGPYDVMVARWASA